MSEAQAERVGAATGIIFVLLIAIGLFVVAPKAPAFNSSPASIQQYYVKHRDDLQAGLLIASFGLFFFVWFLGSLVSHLRGAEGRKGRLTAIVFGSGLIFIGAFIIALAVFAAAAFRPSQTSAEVVRMLNDFGFLLAVPVALVATAFFAGIAKLSFKTRALPGWLSALAVLAAIGNGFAVGGFFKDSGAFSAGDGALAFYVPFISFLLWILLASIVLTARPGVETPAGAGS
jgi:MFS family permease